MDRHSQRVRVQGLTMEKPLISINYGDGQPSVIREMTNEEYAYYLEEKNETPTADEPTSN